MAPLVVHMQHQPSGGTNHLVWMVEGQLKLLQQLQIGRRVHLYFHAQQYYQGENAWFDGENDH